MSILKLDDDVSIQVSWKDEVINLKLFSTGQLERLQKDLKEAGEDASRIFSILRKELSEAGLREEISLQLPAKKIHDLIDVLSSGKKN